MRALFVLGRAIFGGYFAWSGLLVAAACLFGFTFVPLIVFAAWMLALGATFAASHAD